MRGADNSPMRIDLKVPYTERDTAKALGARWDAAKKIWYIMEVADVTPFLRWNPVLKATPKARLVAPHGDRRTPEWLQ